MSDTATPRRRGLRFSVSFGLYGLEKKKVTVSKLDLVSRKKASFLAGAAPFSLIFHRKTTPHHPREPDPQTPPPREHGTPIGARTPLRKLPLVKTTSPWFPWPSNPCSFGKKSEEPRKKPGLSALQSLKILGKEGGNRKTNKENRQKTENRKKFEQKKPRTLFRRRELAEPHWVFAQTLWVLRRNSVS